MIDHKQLIMDNYTGDNTGPRRIRSYDLTKQTDTILVTLNSSLEEAGHRKMLKPSTKVAKDSGCFPLLRQPELADDFSVEGLIEQHHRIGINDQDVIISADFPIPRLSQLDRITQAEVVRRQQIATNWYNQMRTEIERTIPVLHGRTPDDLRLHAQEYEIEDDQAIAFGSNLAEAKPYMNSIIGTKRKPPKSTEKRPSTKMIWRRNIELMPAIRGDGRSIFMLGAGGMNAAPLAALLGAKAVDATSWFASTKLYQLFCTDHGRYIRCGRTKNTIEGEWQQAFLRERLHDETYPLCTERTGLDVDGLTGLFSGNDTSASEARQQHNISELDRDAARLSEFEDDPEGLGAMLRKRWSFGGNGCNLNLLDYALASITDATVQPGIRNYAKMPD